MEGGGGGGGGKKVKKLDMRDKYFLLTCLHKEGLPLFFLNFSWNDSVHFFTFSSALRRQSGSLFLLKEFIIPSSQ